MSPLSAVRLGVDDDVVAVVDAGVDHGVALDAQHEVVVVAAHEGGHIDELLDVLLGQDGHAGGDLPDEGQRARRPEVVHELESPRLRSGRA